MFPRQIGNEAGKPTPTPVLDSVLDPQEQTARQGGPVRWFRMETAELPSVLGDVIVSAENPEASTGALLAW